MEIVGARMVVIRVRVRVLVVHLLGWQCVSFWFKGVGF